ncbi:MAG: hypothetical protein U9N14_04810 [Pseudomonadota bacterium]|nr:hypothetical protein [Pseudomonadota bacterium]
MSEEEQKELARLLQEEIDLRKAANPNMTADEIDDLRKQLRREHLNTLITNWTPKRPDNETREEDSDIKALTTAKPKTQKEIDNETDLREFDTRDFRGEKEKEYYSTEREIEKFDEGRKIMSEPASRAQKAVSSALAFLGGMGYGTQEGINNLHNDFIKHNNPELWAQKTQEKFDHSVDASCKAMDNLYNSNVFGPFRETFKDIQEKTGVSLSKCVEEMREGGQMEGTWRDFQDVLNPDHPRYKKDLNNLYGKLKDKMNVMEGRGEEMIKAAKAAGVPKDELTTLFAEREKKIMEAGKKIPVKEGDSLMKKFMKAGGFLGVLRKVWDKLYGMATSQDPAAKGQGGAPRKPVGSFTP